MTTSAAATGGVRTTTTTATRNDKHISEPSLIHNKITDTSKSYVLVIYAARRVTAGSRVSKIRVTGPAKKHPCTTVVTVTLVIVVQATHLTLHG